MKNIDDMRVGDFLHLLDCMQEECCEHKRCSECRYNEFCDDIDIPSIDSSEIRRNVEGYAEVNWLLDHMHYVNDQRWIPVSERLPENDEYVLASDDCHRVIMAYHNERHGWCSERYGCCYVVAWMPLPEPYTPNKGDTE